MAVTSADIRTEQQINNNKLWVSDFILSLLLAGKVIGLRGKKLFVMMLKTKLASHFMGEFLTFLFLKTVC